MIIDLLIIWFYFLICGRDKPLITLKLLTQKKMNYKGGIDKELNPFSISSWCREGNPEGSNKEMD